NSPVFGPPLARPPIDDSRLNWYSLGLASRSGREDVSFFARVVSTPSIRPNAGCRPADGAGVPPVHPRRIFVPSVSAKELIEAGVHFGHRASRWNPRMRPYIFGRRNLIHIIDVRETIRGLLRAKKYLKQVAAGGSLILFVGTKRQASDTVQRESLRC